MLTRSSVALVALVLLTSVASASVVLRPAASSIGLSVLDPPVKFAGGASGVTTLGPNHTSAMTIKTATNRAEEVLRIQLHAASAQRVNIRLVATSGLGDINKASIAVGGATQVTITNGVVTQSAGPPVALGGDGLSVSGSFKVATLALGAPTLTLDVENRPTPSGPISKQRWVITLA